MPRFLVHSIRRAGCVLVGTLIVAVSMRSLRAEVITLKNGMQLKGALARVKSLNQNPLLEFDGAGGNVDVRKIVLVDDNLRRTFVSSNNVRTDGLAAEGDVSMEKIEIPKPVARGPRRIGAVGPILQVTPFDEFGNRVFSMQGPDGRIDVVQGITEITPTYCKVEGLLVERSFQWNMRVSTASIPRDVLTSILLRQIDQTDPDERLRVVKLYIQAERYRDALVELDRVISDFPEVDGLKEQRSRLYQLVMKDLIREIESRRDAGQYKLAYRLLDSFPEEDVAGELLLRVRDLLTEYEDLYAEAQRARKLIKAHVDELADHRRKGEIDAITQEISTRLNVNNIDRLADYLRLADDEDQGADQKLALAISGWLMGSGSGIGNLPEALSLVEVREAVRDYLRSEGEVDRQKIVERLSELEGNSPSNVAKIIANMRPPVETQVTAEDVPGLLQLSCPGIGDESDFRYYVQLPPEYDPYRRYPCVVTLHGGGSSPLDQIDWWAGAFDPDREQRMGQATRHGYVVIAPVWAEANQSRYKYSLREHAAVLGSVRDAYRRFSIDTDRVFLSGHSMGGDAAWDIGLAHPDLWAGVLPVAATAGKYVSRYWRNAKSLPMYFVAGQLDGNKIDDNARDLDRYLEKAGYDATYVEYRGRGHEHFQDEILRMFDWMSRYRRQFAKREFTVNSMRPWDNFFWWLELEGLNNQFVVLPSQWPKKDVRTAETEARLRENNTIRVKTPAHSATVWLSPDLVDFDRGISFAGNRVEVTPSNEVILWDVLTRGDRQHPFWAKFTPNLGRRPTGR
ncbi:MAG: alpha/beta hydrolase-fold protein [Planctomycetota bacterium]